MKYATILFTWISNSKKTSSNYIVLGDLNVDDPLQLNDDHGAYYYYWLVAEEPVSCNKKIVFI